MNKWFIIILFVLSFVAVYAQNAKSYQANNYSVDMYLLNNGTVRIAEEVVFQFTGGPYHYVNRDVPNAKVDQLLFEKAAMDSMAISTSSVPNFYTLKIHNGLHLKWYYAPLSDETHSFYFQYLVKGIYRIQNGMVHLLWKPLPTEFSYYMDKAIVRVHLPKEIPASRLSFGNEADQTPTIIGDSLLVYQYHSLAPNAVKRIDLLFPKNLIQIKTSNWISHLGNIDNNATLLTYAFIILLILIIVFWIVIAVRLRNQYRRFEGEEIIYEDLPSNLEPALLGRMLSNSATVSSCVYATLVNLAQRGVIKIQSLPQTKMFDTSGRMSFEYVENTVELTPIEQLIIEFVFGKPPRLGTVNLRELQKIIQKNYKYIQVDCDDSLIQCGFIDPFKMEKRKKLLRAGGIGMAIDFAILWGLIIFDNTIDVTYLIMLVILFFTGICILIGGGIIRIFTDSGMMEMASWNAFARYLRKIMKEPNTYTSDDFNRIFPYALVMNLGSEWVNYFKKANIDVGPVWLQSDESDTDSWAPLIMISTISSPTTDSSGGGFSGGGGGSSGGGGGGGGSGAG